MVRIIDASVAIKWFVLETGRDAALGVLAQVLDEPSSFAVPELFYFEVTNVFHRTLPRPSSDQVELLVQILCLGIHRFSMTEELLKGIRRFQNIGLSGYDGSYVALAELLKGKWLTFDNKAHAKVSNPDLCQLLT